LGEPIHRGNANSE